MTDTMQAGDAATGREPSLLTFLIADVRGYTRFTNERGDEAAARLADRFAELCETVLGAYDGRVIELRGDEALAVFPSARNALRGTVALQQAFKQSVADDPSLPLSVGMGLDAGEAIPVRGGYRGGALNLAARLCSIAGAGEILASEGVIHLARKTEGLAFVDRGQVTLKGLAHPVRVLQIAPEGELPDALPPLQQILVTHPTNLPDEPTPFVGREEEIVRITSLLRDPNIRLVTLTGPGGTGKTRLAVQVGSQLLYDFADGVFFCDLAPLSDPALVPSAVASMLSIKEEAGRTLVETLIEQLRAKHLLVVLDNFEHLLDACPVVSQLLDGCRDLHVLVTSRIPLHLSREQEYPVPPLAVPDPRHLPGLDQLSQYESVALFIQRAGAVKPGFAVTNENAPAVAEICARMDGLPLAIELAAARVKLFPPQALLPRLATRLKVLTGGARDKPTRQQTLRGTIDWSYSLLTEEEQVLFARLSVFAGGWNFEAAEPLCNQEGDLDLFEGLSSLVDKSLIRQEGEEEPRFAMLETIREYAAEKLEERGEADTFALQHAEHFAVLAEQAEPEFWGPNSGEWFRRLDTEQANLREALRWCSQSGHPELGLRTAAALGWYWDIRGHNAEGRRWLEALLASGSSAPPLLRGLALEFIGILARNVGDLEPARVSAEDSVRVFEEVGSELNRTRALHHLGTIYMTQGASERAVAVLEEAVEAGRALGPVPRSPLKAALGNLAWTLVMQGQSARAVPFMEEAIDLDRATGNNVGANRALDSLGHARLDLGDVEGATAAWTEGLGLAREVDDRYSTPYHLEGMASVAAVRGDGVRAAKLFAAADAARVASGAALGPGEQGWVDRYTEIAHGLLDEAAWHGARREGGAMALEEAVFYALSECSEKNLSAPACVPWQHRHRDD